MFPEWVGIEKLESRQIQEQPEKKKEKEKRKNKQTEKLYCNQWKAKIKKTSRRDESGASDNIGVPNYDEGWQGSTGFNNKEITSNHIENS